MGAISFNGSIYPAGSTQASDSIYDNTHTGLPASVQGAIDKTTGNIASANSVELATTAAHTHAVGTYFIWIGQFVKVTSAIEVGDTIVDGTNVEATSIADVLAAANGAIEGKLSPSDVVNNLTSTATDLPLSAAMGKSLNDTLDGLSLDVKGWTDITLQCIYNYCIAGSGRILYNETLKLLLVSVFIMNGTPNQSVFLTLPPHIRGTGNILCQTLWDEGSSLESVIIGNLQNGTFRSSHSIDTTLSDSHGIAFLIPVV